MTVRITHIGGPTALIEMAVAAADRWQGRCARVQPTRGWSAAPAALVHPSCLVDHRAIYRVSGGRLGLWRPKPGRWGTLRLTTTGRRTGRPRSVIVGYVEDGPNLVRLAMNGWADPEPAWWLNLQTQPDATVDVAGETRAVRARAAQGAERSRLWATWSEIDRQLDAYAARRSLPTAVVILEPRPAPP